MSLFNRRVTHRPFLKHFAIIRNFNRFPDIFTLDCTRDEPSIEILSQLRAKCIAEKGEGTKYEIASNAVGPTWTMAFTLFARYCCRLVLAGRVESLCGFIRLDDKET